MSNDDFNLDSVINDPPEEDSTYDYTVSSKGPGLPKRFLSAAEFIKQYSEENGPVKEWARPRREFIYEQKTPGVDRPVRPPNPGLNTDPEYTRASQAAYSFQQNDIPAYEEAMAQYKEDKKEHNKNLALGVPSVAPVKPERPKMPIEAKVIRPANEVKRWFRAVGRARKITLDRAGLARQAKGIAQGKTTESQMVEEHRGTKGSLVSIDYLDSEELRKKRQEILDRMDGNRPF